MPRKLGFRLLHGVKSLEFDACISRTELPVDRAYALVAVILPALHLPAEFLDRGHIMGQALPCQDTQFNLGNVEPACMLGRVMDF